MEDAMPTIRNWVIATAAAFLVLPLTNAQARDCKRYPSQCVQPVAAKAAAATSVRVTRQVQKRRAAKRTEKFRTASIPSRAAAREPPANPAVREPPVSPTSRATTTIDSMTMLPQSLAGAAPADLAKRHDRPVVAAAGGGITLPPDDAHAGVELASVDAANAVDPVDAVRFVDPGDAGRNPGGGRVHALPVRLSNRRRQEPTACVYAAPRAATTLTLFPFCSVFDASRPQ